MRVCASRGTRTRAGADSAETRRRRAAAQEFVSIAFTSDNKTIVAQGGAPDWNLTLWNWEKGKQTCSIKPAPSQQPYPVCQARSRARPLPPIGSQHAGPRAPPG